MIKIMEKEADKRAFESQCEPCITKVNHLLLYKKFDECLAVCQQCLTEVKLNLESASARECREALCIVAVQAYAELNRWPEVLPFVTQLYNGIEDCSEPAIQACLLLYSYMKDYTTCNAIAHVWLRTTGNFTKPAYHAVVEVYLQHVLIPQKHFEGIPPFLDTCGGLDRDRKNGYLKCVRTLQDKVEQDAIQVLERHLVAEGNNTAEDKKNAIDVMAERLSDIAKRLTRCVLKVTPYLTLTLLRNVALAAVLLYLVTVEANFDFVSRPQLLAVFSALARLWKSMFAPFHSANS